MSNTTSNGRKKSLRALVVAGNKNGLAGTSRILYRRYSMEYEPTLNFSESILKKPARFFFSFFFSFFFLTISGLSL